DEPAAEGGTDQGPTPVDAFLAGLLGCLTISFKAAGRRRNVPIERVDGHVKTNENGHLKEIRLTLEVWSPAPEENVRALLERAERGCYISALLKPEVDYQLELFVHPS
ncbi:MAG TPA: OsmC family protein, partial [Tepidiformaceae bacterium]